ncbi:hypothetical protein LMTR13_23785 [Bradyrhizobium icense]|uniref:Uncharacterized protein n=1 Tax=Bradyrhizobium icense TaxID=1274631 RepID=A0A1B1UJ10_9BRAD|nr:hypothetical protein LMTR13_23785 [Bradyrhizobium icense]
MLRASISPSGNEWFASRNAKNDLKSTTGVQLRFTDGAIYRNFVCRASVTESPLELVGYHHGRALLIRRDQRGDFGEIAVQVPPQIRLRELLLMFVAASFVTLALLV